MGKGCCKQEMVQLIIGRLEEKQMKENLSEYKVGDNVKIKFFKVINWTNIILTLI